MSQKEPESHILSSDVCLARQCGCAGVRFKVLESGIHRYSTPSQRAAALVQCFLEHSASHVLSPALPQPVEFGDEATSFAATCTEPRMYAADFVIIGSGIAGLTYALKVAEYGEVSIVTKGGMSDGCTAYAQGGVCAVLDPLDSVESHVHDTMVAGNFLNDRRCA